MIIKYIWKYLHHSFLFVLIVSVNLLWITQWPKFRLYFALRTVKSQDCVYNRFSVKCWYVENYVCVIQVSVVIIGINGELRVASVRPSVRRGSMSWVARPPTQRWASNITYVDSIYFTMCWVSVISLRSNSIGNPISSLDNEYGILDHYQDPNQGRK